MAARTIGLVLVEILLVLGMPNGLLAEREDRARLARTFDDDKLFLHPFLDYGHDLPTRLASGLDRAEAIRQE